MDNMEQVIDWFEVPVSDMSRAQAFYEAVSGFDQA
jgi:predicted enzyme related to lactoylglutathione lyase